MVYIIKFVRLGPTTIRRMPSTAKVSRAHCIFCNSLSHTSIACNSNMQGRRNILTETGRTFMLDDVLPEFISFPLNELRFIASIYEKFQKKSDIRSMRRMYGYFDRRCLVDYLHSPIPTTLTKSRMVKELAQRWKVYAPVRLAHNHEKPDDVDCPICMDCMSSSTWNPCKLRWDMVLAKLSDVPGESFVNNIRTECGHTFCSSCWRLHVNANSKIEYSQTSWAREPTGRMILACPMCRHQMYYTR